jgi:nucleoid-associated protein YgaU
VALSESTLKVRSSPDATAGADSTAPTTGVVRVKPGAAAPPPASTGGAAAPGSVNPVRPAATLTTLNPGAAGAVPGKTFPVEHTVVSGDTYWGLSRKYYGSSSHTELIKTANKGVTPQPGKKLVIPTPPAAAETTPQPSGRTVSPDPARAVASGTPPAEPKSGEVAGFSIAALPADADYYYYTVQKGDTLSGLAKRFYADSTSFHRIQGANKHLHYEMLRAGMKIRIPKAAK